MKDSIKKVGTISSVIALASFVVYMLCFIAILFVNEPYIWQGFEHFIEYEKTSITVFKYIGMACMLVYSLAFFSAVACVGLRVDGEKRLYAKLSQGNAIAFMICVCIAYFVQLTATRMQLLSGNAEGILQYTQSYKQWYSA